MKENNIRQNQAKVLRIFRKIHRLTGAFLFAFFFIVSITALLLGWKKHSRGLILSKSYAGTSNNLTSWLPLDSLHSIATKILHDSISKETFHRAGPH